MLKININTKDILDACKDSVEDAKKQLSKSVGDLAIATQKHILELADAELSPSLKQIFRGKENEHNIRLDTISSNVHVITLSGSAYWIEEGIEPGTDQKTDKWLFKSKSTKTSKDGYRYLVVPFEHSKAPSTQTGYEKNLTDRIKFELKAQNKIRKSNGLPTIPWAGIETDKHGKPKEGLLHEFNFTGSKAKSSWSHNPLDKLRVYQAVEKDAQGNAKLTKGGKAKVSRSWMTFRTASENPKPNPETGVSPKEKFIHPGFTAKKFMDKSAEWAEQEFYNKILPGIFAKWGDKL
jgi:hypothetical protein